MLTVPEGSIFSAKNWDHSCRGWSLLSIIPGYQYSKADNKKKCNNNENRIPPEKRHFNVINRFNYFSPLWNQDSREERL